MPIYWRFLLGQFLKVLLLSTLSFIAILLTTRLDEIAHFATLGSNFWLVMRFAANQVPYILPIAIPVSCLISAMLLFQRLSSTYELTALRASGLSLRRILAPLLIASTYLCLINFFIVSELSTDSHLFNNALKNELRSVNPLLLLHNKHILKSRGIYFDTLGPSRIGETAADVVLAMPSHDSKSLHVVVAKKLEAKPDHFSGEHVTLITPIKAKGLLLENMGHTSITISDFSQIVQSRMARIHLDHLRWSLLRTKLSEEKDNPDRKQAYRIYTEMVRRFSVAFAALTFTLMGAAFGLSISRRPSYRGVFAVLALATVYLVCFFAAKGIDDHLIAASLLYTLPQIFIILLSVWMLRRTSEGIE